MPSHHRTAVLLVLTAVCFTCCSAPPAARADDDLLISTPRITTGAGGGASFTSAGSISGKELGDLVQNEIGTGNYQLATFLLNTCHSGAGLNTIKGALDGPNRIVTGCSAGQLTQIRFKRKSKEVSGFFPTVFDSSGTDPNKPLQTHIDKGKDKDPRNPDNAQEEEQLKKKYERRRAARTKYNQKRIADGKKALPELPAWENGGRDLGVQEPQTSESAGGLLGMKLAAGNSSNHAIIYQTDGRPATDAEVKKTKESLMKQGFDSIKHLTPLNSADFKAISDAFAANMNPAIRDDAAMPDKLKKALMDLKPMMNNMEQIAIIVAAHGHSKNKSARTAGAPAGAGGGGVVNRGASSDAIIEFETLNYLAEEAMDFDGSLLLDEPWYSRWGQPSLIIQTAEEQNPSNQPVGVFLGGQFLADMQLDPQGTGFHEFPLPDAMVADLVNFTDLTGGIPIDFQFADNQDFFRLATIGDLEAQGGLMGHDGISLFFPIEGATQFVPEPSTLCLCLIAMLALAAARRRKF